MWGRHTVSELEVRALGHLRDMDLRMLMIDEVHNLLAGSYREQRRFLNMLRFLANDLCASLVVFGVNEALEAVRGDDQLARRLDEHYLPLWEDDVEFSRLIQTLIAAMALEQRSGLTVASLRPPPMHDELLSSWIGRLAKANHCSVEELCGHLGLGQGRVPECAGDLRVVNWGRLCGAVQRSRDEIVSMALPDTTRHDVQCVSRHDFQYCPGCVAKSPDLVLRHWRLAWSMTCETCGQALAAKHPAKDVSGWLRARALRGAEALETIVATNNLARLRRISLTLHLMSVLEIGNLGALTSGNECERLMALSAIGVGMTRPILGAAVVLRGNDRVVRELRRVFPSHRQVVERIRKLSQDLDRRLPGRCETGHPTEQEIHGMSRPIVSESALRAARQAITELGTDANRQALLARADEIWKRSSGAKS